MTVPVWDGEVSLKTSETGSAREIGPASRRALTGLTQVLKYLQKIYHKYPPTYTSSFSVLVLTRWSLHCVGGGRGGRGCS